MKVVDGNTTDAVSTKDDSTTSSSNSLSVQEITVTAAPQISSQSNLPDFEAPPLFHQSKVHRIYWMHVQKTGGSFFMAIFFRFCPAALIAEQQATNGKLKKARLSDLALLKNYPPEKWCYNKDLMFYNMPNPGYHHPYIERRPNEEFFTMTMFRNPIERLWSAYNFGRHGSTNPDKHQSTFEEYIQEPNIFNCQLKMVLGHHCHKQRPQQLKKMGPLNISLAIERVSQPRFFFGITGRWAESMCLFHRWFGGKVLEDIDFVNTRKGDTPGGYRGVVLPVHDELEWFEGIMPIFEARLQAVNCVSYVPA
ncbi:expressed unknown protein [Seminavis robusta]|uniref:Uncharacterized protein n=1 Tax=Seminavis robusta TaxID=568900 RepID=A0A9N8DL28_9STRA|nr:expressed unknown protein [Seminavis robusta]|eukprot:Sro214_g088750.1 n/a (308) ;mRNA; f:46619-47542